MKNKLITVILIVSSIAFLMIIPMVVFAEEPPIEPAMPGRIAGTGTYFEITYSEYLNVSLQSTEEITVLLESIPRTVSLHVEASTLTDSIVLVLRGLEPNKTYYKFEDSYKNEVEFTTDGDGGYNWTQDLTQSRHIWFQPGDNGTIYLPDQCATYGTWDPTISTCIINQNLVGSVEITTDNIVLDCDGHNITGTDTGYGIYLNSKSIVEVKNCTITHFSKGTYLFSSSNNTFGNNTVSNNWFGIELYYYSSGNIFKNNTSDSNVWFGISFGNNANDNLFTNNKFSSNNLGIFVSYLTEKNIFTNNIISNNRNYGISAFSSHNNIFTDNSVNDNYWGIRLSFSNGNTFTDNIISSNHNYGIYLDYSKNNKIYHDNLINNGIQAYVYYGVGNLFDNGYPDGGNYWSNFDMPTEGCNDVNFDGFCDLPYAFYGGQDRYPFMEKDGWKIPVPEKMVKPAEGQITSPFGERKIPKPEFHPAIDIWNKDMEKLTTEVKSPAFGKVLKVHRDITSGAGKWIWIWHGDVVKLDDTIAQEISTRYLHLDRIDVEEGDSVSLGTVIGVVGDTGKEFLENFKMKSHLQFQVRQGSDQENFLNTIPINPEGFIMYETPPEKLIVKGFSPIDLIITDPDGLIVSKEINELPEIAGYLEIGDDPAEDLSGYDYVAIKKRKLGDYFIKVVPEPQALSTDIYNLEVTSAATTTVLARNLKISEIPEFPYIIRSTETTIERIIPAKVRIEPETLNLDSKGVFTAFVQIPKGFGSAIQDIDPNTIAISGASAIQTTISKGTHTFIARFNRQDLKNARPDKEVGLTFKGKLFDGTTIEGSDIIRVIRYGVPISD